MTVPGRLGTSLTPWAAADDAFTSGDGVPRPLVVRVQHVDDRHARNGFREQAPQLLGIEPMRLRRHWVDGDRGKFCALKGLQVDVLIPIPLGAASPQEDLRWVRYN